MQLYAFMPGKDKVHVPEPVQTLSTDRLLTAKWLYDPLIGYKEHHWRAVIRWQ